jgi:hypothetical protein
MKKQSCRLPLHQVRCMVTEWSLWTSVEGMWNAAAADLEQREGRSGGGCSRVEAISKKNSCF